MKAAVLSKFGLENLRIEEMDEPKQKHGFIRIKTKFAGINPLEYNVIAGKVLYGVSPMPHIPGSEIFGESMDNGNLIKKGDRVIIYNREYDGKCNLCISGKEYLCPNGGLWGVMSNGGYSEIISVREENVFKVPDTVSDYVATSLPIDAITAYHALKEANSKPGESLLVYGASGNTGLFSLQLGRIFGMKVTAISRNDFVKEFGADEIFSMENIPLELEADVIINPLGGEILSGSLSHLRRRGRLVSFGVLTGVKGEIDIGKLYTRELRIIGSTGGSRMDLNELLSIADKENLRVQVDKIFPLSDIKSALNYFSGKRKGRVLLSFQ